MNCLHTLVTSSTLTSPPHIFPLSSHTATKHPILTIAPNCLSCGKIICTLEGPGPCTFCGTPVLSRDQQHALITEAKRKRAEEAQARQRAASKKAKAPGAGGGTVAYSAKLSGAVIPRKTEEVDWEEEERKEAERLSLAEAHKERLLEFDRTSAKRSKVI
ncbi:putative zinc finger motif, C2HC5-type-domain-containing protein, partial [Jimgerdemannia flammicorona]